MTKKEALKLILSDTKSYKTSLNYAVDYTLHALTLEEGSLEFETQILYVLNNITHWRHKDAKEVRKTLKGKTNGRP